MRLSICLLCCSLSVSVLGCGGGDDQGTPSSTPPPNSGPTDNTAADSGFAQAMLSAHNSTRANASPAPSPALAPLTWSTDIAKKAQAWADKCMLDRDPSNAEFGVNISGTTAYVLTTARMVQLWASEASAYDYSTHACANGKFCEDYTQLVWRDTTQVGCAMKLCNENSPFASVTQWQVWVCYYWPAGNQGGLPPY